MLQDHPTLLSKYYGRPVSVSKKKELPKTYLYNLPRIKYKAYIDAHVHWDTGITPEMMEGSRILASCLRKILNDLATLVYPTDYFEGKTTETYYDDIINRVMPSAFEAQPHNPGTMHRVIAHGQISELLDEMIVNVVKDSIDILTFEIWKSKWDYATKMGAEGKDIDLTTDPHI